MGLTILPGAAPHPNKVVTSKVSLTLTTITHHTKLISIRQPRMLPSSKKWDRGKEVEIHNKTRKQVLIELCQAQVQLG